MRPRHQSACQALHRLRADGRAWRAEQQQRGGGVAAQLRAHCLAARTRHHDERKLQRPTATDQLPPVLAKRGGCDRRLRLRRCARLVAGGEAGQHLVHFLEQQQQVRCPARVADGERLRRAIDAEHHTHARLALQWREGQQRHGVERGGRRVRVGIIAQALATARALQVKGERAERAAHGSATQAAQHARSAHALRGEGDDPGGALRELQPQLIPPAHSCHL
mmetsp:Transcript_9932/g.26164  ORF Transcript_9932/g.26164 Transcript_9932/m.26164 type:complete len:222 (-) Transcript_9932:57-722(-)